MTDTAKPKQKKTAAPKKPADHPKYSDMIAASIEALKEKSGSSRQAIGKYIRANYNVGDGYETHLKMGLKRGVASGKLLQPKGTGASGSFKNAKAAKPIPEKPKRNPKNPPRIPKKPEKPTKPKKSTPKKTSAKKSKAKKPAMKKAGTLKKSAAKKPAKKPTKPAKKSPKKQAKKPGKKPAKKLEVTIARKMLPCNIN